MSVNCVVLVHISTSYVWNLFQYNFGDGLQVVMRIKSRPTFKGLVDGGEESWKAQQTSVHHDDHPPYSLGSRLNHR
jgi:hypothetical protein